MDNDQLLNQIQLLLEGTEQRTVEAIKAEVRGSETRMLTQFFGWLETNEKKLRNLEVNLTPLLERQSALEARQLMLEKRLNDLEGAA